ncbi:MAG: CRISPR-associated endonuclease Cas2 [Anaerolineae bacterium]|nr:CRISPR-associated endonuclease Cas2 [Anaerolineae bacterium]
MRYVVSYDISNDKRRRKVVKVLEGVGFRVQYSVFECDLDSQRLKALRKQLKPLIQPKSTDSIRFYGLCADCQKRVDVLGNDLSKTLGIVLIV